jgi:hypothetical protein
VRTEEGGDVIVLDSLRIKENEGIINHFVLWMVFLSMVVWQPFKSYWRYIIAHVSEMHVAYHISTLLVVYLHQRNKQRSTSQRLCDTSLSFLPSLPASSNVCVRGEKRGGERADIECG